MHCEIIPDTTSRQGRSRVVVRVLAVLVLAVLAGGCAGRPSSHAPATADPGDRYQRVMRVAAAAEADGDLVAAGSLYESANAIAPTRAEPAVRLATLATALGDAHSAVRYWRTAVAVEPDAPVARRGLGAALLALDEPADAVQQFHAAIASDPDDAASYNGLGVSLDLLGRHEEARQAYAHGLDRAPGAFGLTNNLALSLALTRDFDAAIAMLRTIADRPDAGPRVRQNLALVYALAGRQDEAAATAARDLPPREARANLAFYQALQGLSGRGLAAAVFHANLEAAPGTALDAASVAAGAHSTAAALEPNGLPAAAPEDTVAAAPAAIVECLAPDQIDEQLAAAPPVTEAAAPRAVGPTRTLHQEWAALADPARAPRPALRGVRFAWTAAEHDLKIDPEWVAPPRVNDAAPTPASAAMNTALLSAAAAVAVAVEPFLVPEGWRPQPLLVDVVEVAPQPAAVASAEADPTRPEAAVTVLIDVQPAEEGPASLWNLVQGNLVQVGYGYSDDEAPAAGVEAMAEAAAGGGAPNVLAVVRAVAPDPHPAPVALSGSAPVVPPAGPVDRSDAFVGLVAARAREGPPVLPE